MSKIGLYEKEEIDKLYLSFMKYEGIKEGEIIGKRIGEKKGEKIGVCKVAKNLLKENADMSFIQKVTNLSNKQIKKLKLELQEDCF